MGSLSFSVFPHSFTECKKERERESDFSCRLNAEKGKMKKSKKIWLHQVTKELVAVVE